MNTEWVNTLRGVPRRYVRPAAGPTSVCAAERPALASPDATRHWPTAAFRAGRGHGGAGRGAATDDGQGGAPGGPGAGPGRAGWGRTSGAGQVEAGSALPSEAGPWAGAHAHPVAVQRAVQRSCVPAGWMRARAFWSDGRKGRQAGGRAPGRLAGGRAARAALSMRRGRAQNRLLHSSWYAPPPGIKAHTDPNR